MPDNVKYNRIPTEVLQRWRTVRDVLSGDQAVRAGGYLPMLNSFDRSPENVARNAAYNQRAVWYPATQYTLEGLLGMAFRVDPDVDLPSEFEYLVKNVDGAGTSLYQQAQETLINVLGPGRHGLYADWSEPQKGGIIKAYHAENIINWKYRNVNGEMKLTLVVLEEDVEVEGPRFELQTRKQWRELALEDDKFVVRLWIDGSNEEPQLVMQTNSDGEQVQELVVRSQVETFDFIPFVFVGSDKNNGERIGPSPLYGLASLNLAHFRNSADHEDSVFYTGQAQPYMTGLDIEWRNWMMAPTVMDENGNFVSTGQRMYVGSRAPLLLPQGATFGYASPDPNTLTSDAMKHKEAQMIAIGARLIEPSKPGSRTATEDNNDKETTTSVLAMCVANVNEAYQQVLAWCARWKGRKEIKTDDWFHITQEFVGTKVDPATLREVVASWQTGITAKNDVRDYMRKVGLLGSERTNELIEADIEKEGPRPGTMGLEDEGTPPGSNPQQRPPAKQGSGQPTA